VTPEVRARLAKLLTLATRPGTEGEGSAAFGRVVALAVAHDVDWTTALAGGNGSALKHEEMTPIYNAGREQGLREAANARPQADDWAAAGQPRTHEAGRRLEELEEILEAAERSADAGLLNDFETEFAQSMRDRVGTYRGRLWVTPKQWAVLDRLKTKLARQNFYRP
jgi:hypothetical protein